RFVFLFDGGPVGAVHVRVVEEVAVDAPGLVEDLLPFGAGFDADFDGVEIEAAIGGIAGCRGRCGGPALSATAARWGRGRCAAAARRRRDEPVAAGGIEQFAAVGR